MHNIRTHVHDTVLADQTSASIGMLSTEGHALETQFTSYEKTAANDVQNVGLCKVLTTFVHVHVYQ